MPTMHNSPRTPRGAVVSHLAAASVWALPFDESERLDITVAGSNPGARPVLRIHVVGPT